MLLTLLELWQALDTIAIDLYPILGDFDPGFPQNLLYPLQVSELTDMCRLQKLEKYIERRHSSARFPMSHVLGEMAHDSFAARYFDQCEEMQDLHGIINAADGELKGRKEFEWIQKSSEYEAILNEAARTACLFMEDEFDPLKRQHDDRRCRKHFLERKAARMRIQIHEALLPIDPATAKAVIFELRIPPGFATWRDATWQILQIGQRQQIPDRPPHVFLYDYPGLRSYMEPTGCGITLASRTKYVLSTQPCSTPMVLHLIYTLSCLVPKELTHLIPQIVPQYSLRPSAFPYVTRPGLPNAWLEVRALSASIKRLDSGPPQKPKLRGTLQPIFAREISICFPA